MHGQQNIKFLFISKKNLIPFTKQISTFFGSYTRATMSTTTHEHALNTTLQLQS